MHVEHILAGEFIKAPDPYGLVQACTDELVLPLGMSLNGCDLAFVPTELGDVWVPVYYAVDSDL